MSPPFRILAENFDNVWIPIFGLPILLTLLAAFSCIPSSRARRSGPALALTAMILGALLFLAFAFGKAACFVLVVSLLPVAVGIISLSLFAERRGRQ